MINCSKCGTMMAPSLMYSKRPGSFGMSAGSACPKCEPHRAIVQDTPAWFQAAMDNLMLASINRKGVGNAPGIHRN